MQISIGGERLRKLAEAVRSVRVSRGGQDVVPSFSEVEAEVLCTVDFRIRQLEELAARTRLETRPEEPR